MERAGDTRTAAPCIYKDSPWALDFSGQFGLDAGNFEQLQGGAGTIFQQNFGDIAYYVQGEYLYLSRGWQTVRHRARGTARGDFHLADLSDGVKLSLPVIGTAAYDNLLKLEPRVTFGGGLWVDFQDKARRISNGISLFATGEYERGGDLPETWTPRFSLRNYFKVKFQERSHFILDAYYAPAMGDFADYRASVAPGLSFALTDLLSLTWTTGAEYTSRPRDPSVKKYDVNMMIGLTVNLGPKPSEAAAKP